MDKRRIVIVVGLVAAVLCGIFLPRINGETQQVYKRGFLLSSELYGVWHSTSRGSSLTPTEIDFGKLGIEWIIIGLMTSAVWLAMPLLRKE
jgi:hypothetical protein